jgi:diguanylate cyclase (GGDEF)-like protein
MTRQSLNIGLDMVSPKHPDAFTRGAIRDTAFVVVGFAISYLLARHFQWFERLSEFSEQHESWELDELFVAIIVLAAMTCVTSINRLRETLGELKRRKEAELRANLLAMHDPLTGLPNRRFADDAITRGIAQADKTPFALLLLDLNRYKSVNDLHGHGTGDQLLLEVGRRLKAWSGRDSWLARLGGDEFVIVLPGVISQVDLVTAVDRISHLFDKPFKLENTSVIIGASIGVTLCESVDAKAEELLREADAAMYRSKQRGQNGFAFFEPGMEQMAINRARIELELRQAIFTGQIVPFYQPLIELETGETIGFEVLARWRLADGTVRMPDDFIPIAEETGLIGDLFYSLLRQASREIGHWPPHYSMAVNLSPVQFADEWLVERILQILVENGVAPRRLELEMTETAIVNEIEHARTLIERLKSQGIKVALDDFGTGYSSLRHLSELRFDKLKIDRSFIGDLDANEASQTIVKTVTALAHSLGLTVCVEGIETEASAENVTSYGCDFAQGYLFGRPAAKACFKARDDQPTVPESRAAA